MAVIQTQKETTPTRTPAQQGTRWKGTFQIQGKGRGCAAQEQEFDPLTQDQLYWNSGYFTPPFHKGKGKSKMRPKGFSFPFKGKGNGDSKGPGFKGKGKGKESKGDNVYTAEETWNSYDMSSLSSQGPTDPYQDQTVLRRRGLCGLLVA